MNSNIQGFNLLVCEEYGKNNPTGEISLEGHKKSGLFFGINQPMSYVCDIQHKKPDNG
jgi:hypothetical protein